MSTVGDKNWQPWVWRIDDIFTLPRRFGQCGRWIIVALEGDCNMRKRCAGLIAVFFAMLFSPVFVRPQNTSSDQAQGAKEQKATPATNLKLLDGWGQPVSDPLHGQKPGPAP